MYGYRVTKYNNIPELLGLSDLDSNIMLNYPYFKTGSIFTFFLNFSGETETLK